MSGLKPGLTGEIKIKVEFDHTAAKFGSGLVEVLATPVMIGLMEGASQKAVAGFLPEGHTTVGTVVNVKHLAATPIGMEVRASAVLREVDGRRLVFDVKAYDDKERIGEGVHERFIINTQKFMQKNMEKKAST